MDKNTTVSDDRGGIIAISNNYITVQSARLVQSDLTSECATKISVNVIDIIPTNCTYPEGFVWVSGDSSICSIAKLSNFEAEITFLTLGTTTISCTHPEIGLVGNISCAALPVTIQDFVLNTGALDQEYLTSASISITSVIPSNYHYPENFTFASSNPAVCDIVKTNDLTATVNFIAQGTCSINVTHPNYHGIAKTIACTSRAITLKSFELSTTSLSQEYSTSASVLVVSLVPANFTNVGGFTWSTSNGAVCTVTKVDNTSATINFVSQGSCTITVSHPDLPAKTIACTALPVKLKSYALSNTSLSQEYSTSASVSVTALMPANFTNVTGFTWSSDNPGVCTVSKTNNTTAMINFVAQGNATITVNHPDVGSKTIACTSRAITLKSFTLSTTAISGVNGSVTDVSITPTPGNFTNVGGFTWTTDNGGVATVTKLNNFSARISFVNVGNCNILVSHPDVATKYISCSSQTIPVTSVALYGEVNPYPWNGYQLGADAQPTNATNRAVSWSVSNAALASVTANGYVTNKNIGGSVTIYATSVSNPNVAGSHTTIIKRPIDVWTKQNTQYGENVSLYAIAFGNNFYVAVGEDNIVYNSIDLVNWTKRAHSPGQGLSLNDVCFGHNSIFVAVGKSQIIYTSSDGDNWAERSGPYDSYLNGVANGNGMYVAVGDIYVATSGDGYNWTRRTSGVADYMSAVTFGNGLFIAVSDSGHAKISNNNGVSWSSIHISAQPLYDIAFANGIFIAVGDYGTLITSSDGYNWNARGSTVSQTLYGITYGYGLYVATGNNGVVIVSSDGYNWGQAENSYTANSIDDIMYLGQHFIAVGSDGIILTSRVY